MSRVACRACGRDFEGTRNAWCPGCLAGRWLETPGLIRAKHDPAAAAASLERYRSIVTPRLVDDLGEVLDDAAQRGRWFWDRDYGMWVHVTLRPLGRAPGVGIPAGRAEPDHALDCLFIAEADSRVEAHLFAADSVRHAAQVRAGVFEPLGVCVAPDCPNLRRPGGDHCGAHDPAPDREPPGPER